MRIDVARTAARNCVLGCRRRLARQSQRWMLVMCLTAGGLLGAGCASSRNTLGTASSPCFKALPAATTAVHERGRLLGVLLVPAKKLATDQHLSAALSTRSSTKVSDVCLIAFSGSFLSNQVDRPLGALSSIKPDPYAVVVVSIPQNQLLATFVLPHPPLRFGHYFAGQ